MQHPMPSGIVAFCHRACGATSGPAHKQPRAPLAPASQLQCGWGLGPAAAGRVRGPSPLRQQPNTSQTLAKRQPTCVSQPEKERNKPASGPPRLNRTAKLSGLCVATQAPGGRQQNGTGLSLPHFVSGDTRNANRQLQSTEMSWNHWNRHS
mgnify:CR=1 FL=1